MSNHLSNFDIPILLAFLPIQFRWLIKKELYKIPLFGFTLKRAGYIRIDRANRHSAIRSIKEAAAIIRNGVSIMIFPEGTRSKDGDLQSFKKGGFVLAVESGVPILPIVIHGTYGIMPKKQIRIIPGNVILEVCPPVEVSDYTMENKDELLKNVRNIVLDAYEKGKEQKL
jgi:1-acyl-sn-glycerol-3-phosphate acyltransferase